MTILHSPTDNTSGEMPTTPVDDAAMQYAHNGIPVVLFDARLGNHKQCGNLVGDASAEGDKWHEHVSTDATVIAGWFKTFGARATGIATSPGAADCVVLDVDRPDEVPEHWWQWLKTAPFQSTRTDDDRRGHYWFDQPPGERIGCPVMAWGEVRGDGGGLILSPTPHAKPNGRYKWIRRGDTRTLPDAITAELRAKGQRQGGAVKVTDAAVTDFATKHVTTARSDALAPIVAQVSKADAKTRDATRDALCWAARGARVGKFGWTEARDAIEDAARESYERRSGQFDSDDFARLERYAIEQALTQPLDALEARENRPSGTDTRDITPDIESALVASGIKSTGKVSTDTTHAGQADQPADSDAKGLESGDQPDDEFTDAVEHEARRIRIRQAARNVIAREQWDEPDDQGDLAHQIDYPQPELGYLVADLIPARGFVLINAQYKVGKSTLASVNLTHALATGTPFLRRYETSLGENENIAIWNLEVDQATLTGWLQRTGMDRNAQKRIHPMCLRGNRSVDFDNELAVEWTVLWLSQRNVAVWVIDPLSKLYRDDEQDNSAFNRWWLRVEDITARAGVRVVVLVHHTGHDESTADRARGASAMMGNPDVLVTYRHAGRHGGHPPDSKRYLSAIGRNVEVREFELDYKADSGELYATGSGTNRVEARRRKAAVSVWEHLQTTAATLNKTALLDAVKLPSKGKGAGESTDVLDYAEGQGWIVMVLNGRTKLYSCGAATPPMAERSAAWMASAANGPIITQSADGSKNAP